VSVILFLFLSETGWSDTAIGGLLSLTLAGDVLISLGVTSVADRVGRKRMLLFGAGLMTCSGLAFALSSHPAVLALAAVIGIVSPSGNEIGPFLSIEQAALSQITDDRKRTSVFAWYNLAGSFATASGALSAGVLSGLLQQSGVTAIGSHRIIMGGYTACGVLLALLFMFLTRFVEAKESSGPDRDAKPTRNLFGLHRSRRTVFRLSSLFALDAFAGGFVVQSIMAYWFHARFGLGEGALGNIFFWANLLAGVSALLAARIASRIGLVNTMVFTHIPSNILLFLVPLMPGPGWAVAVLLLRFSISQMDVPTRQSYTMAVVAPDERTAASGITGIARSVGAAISPALSGVLLSHPALFGVPFFIAGGLKIAYDIRLYQMFRHVTPAEEVRR
jgi:MFS family permease